jgi:hypothetical protein
MEQNLFRAAIYNVVAIPIAAGALFPFGILLRPEFGAIAMSASSITGREQRAATPPDRARPALERAMCARSSRPGACDRFHEASCCDARLDRALDAGHARTDPERRSRERALETRPDPRALEEDLADVPVRTGLPQADGRCR